MKKIITKYITAIYVISAIVISSNITANAQWYDDTYTSSYDTSIVDSSWGNTSNSWTDDTISNWSSYSDNNWTNPSTVSVQQGCTNCSTGGWVNDSVSNWSSYSDNNWTNPSTVSVQQGCTNCSTGVTNWTNYGNTAASSWSSPVVWSQPAASTNWSAYSSGASYTPATYGYTNYGSSNNSTSFTCPTGYIKSGYSCKVATVTVTTTSCPSGSSLVNGVCTVNTVTCPSGSSLVNGSCVRNTTACASGSTLVNGVCTINTTSCPTGTTLVNGVCTHNQISCPSGSTLVNGSCVVNNSTCPSGSSLVNGVCTINSTTCPSGSTLVNGSCVINSRTCASGSTWNGSYCIAPTTCSSGTTWNGSSCVAPTTCPSGSSLVNGVCTINTTSCPTGTTLVNGVCTINNAVCPSGSSLVNGMCTVHQSYQTCWDGSRISTSSSCPSQYKTCPNGMSVLMSQSCPITVVNPPVSTVAFNNVVTSVVTNITKSTAMCNGIGLIANGTPSTGWFEFGTTPNLGYTSQISNIGTSNTAPFSTTLTGLKTGTAYYCRAIMNNQYGTVKGEIVRFVTKTNTVVYVAPKPIAVKPVVKTTTDIVCSDGSILKTSSASISTMIANGQKLMSLNLTKVAGETAIGAESMHRLAYKNVSTESLKNVTIKVSIPAEYTITGSNAGVYDQNTRTLSLTIPSLSAGGEGALEWKVRVVDNAVAGRSTAMTTYASYQIVGTNGQTVTDEVTAYGMSTISASSDKNTNVSAENAKKAVGTGLGSILPGTLLEWTLLIAVMFIVFIVGRSVLAIVRGGDHH